MKFNIGDRVSFINEKQDGTIQKILSGGRVMVAIEDGFELEVSEKELVKIAASPKAAVQQKVEEPATDESKTSLDDLLLLVQKGQVGIITIPARSGAVLTGPVDFYLVNNTIHQLLFTFYADINQRWRGKSSGVLEPGSYKKLMDADRQNLIDVKSFFVQGMLYNESVLEQNNYFKKEITLLLPDINSGNNALKGLLAFAKTQLVYNSQGEEPIDLDQLKDKFSPSPVLSQKNKKQVANSPDPKKYGILETEKEVDLHIEELTDDISSLSNGEMLNIQMQHFTKEMDNAIRKNFHRIIFIHGVGNGRLKQEIRKELHHYKGIRFRDADASRYGQGATEVILL